MARVDVHHAMHKVGGQSVLACQKGVSDLSRQLRPEHHRLVPRERERLHHHKQAEAESDRQQARGLGCGDCEKQRLNHVEVRDPELLDAPVSPSRRHLGQQRRTNMDAELVEPTVVDHLFVLFI
eukprot:Lithocolla_globosa_v1_NODE_1714_length_2385_cov_6.393562.p3 type:complete len:124 gc:universal NODE_1714_length_2385_cov_6.393562:1978-1607(-)